MLQYVNYRMRITILDGRVLVGTLMAFDRHLNLVSDCGSSPTNCCSLSVAQVVILLLSLFIFGASSLWTMFNGFLVSLLVKK